MNSKIQVVQGDITRVQVDAIVNAANTSLMGGGGVDGAIHRAGGPAILEECKKIVARQGGCKTGQAVVTTGGKLPVKFVIHTVGPIWRGGQNGEPEKLASCYRSSMHLAIDHQCKSIAFPNTSTGVYGFPKERAAQIAVNAVKELLHKPGVPETILFVCFDEENFQLMQQQLRTANLE